MANWKYKIDISKDWKKYKNDEIDIDILKKNVSVILKKEAEQIKEENFKIQLIEIANRISNVDDIDEFDDITNDLYDWGDIIIKPSNSVIQNRLAWIKTDF